ncbi:DUF2726 domain-containing protein [Micromonospora narathiwatensis]|uniref:Uncharacterized protein n=1 Tax=Micromonospora narathiwatensis TaxID=299146 RepID=A0A1A8ZEU6_9ACTN|nr:DUF2726 domain-containing protein [Micromonospora narathiwatensis]SBT42355.1 Protein of unknown function (DUF2726) [Micromonospora narathiwatensis]
MDLAEMTSSGSVAASWLRPVTAGGAPSLTRAGQFGYESRRLGELVQGRPPGVTGNQWSTALREGFDQVVCAADGRPVFAVQVAPPAPAGSAARRAERMTSTVCAAVGLPVLRVESSTLRGAEHSRRLVEYVIDARSYAAGSGPEAGDAVGFREIVGRLPDGRSGPVNDLGALARAAAVEAYVERRLADPIVRGLHVRWTGGPAEGWSWIEVRPGRCLVERVELLVQRFSCGVDPGRLAEDLAAVAVGERLRDLDAVESSLVDRDELRERIRRLATRRDEFDGGFAFDHLCED